MPRLACLRHPWCLPSRRRPSRCPVRSMHSGLGPPAMSIHSLCYDPSGLTYSRCRVCGPHSTFGDALCTPHLVPFLSVTASTGSPAMLTAAVVVLEPTPAAPLPQSPDPTVPPLPSATESRATCHSCAMCPRLSRSLHPSVHPAFQSHPWYQDPPAMTRTIPPGS